MERYYKDPEIRGIYVKRCKCGARPYFDRIAATPFPKWIACNCGRKSESDLNKQAAINNWNNDKLVW